jgi:hypothetical protein
MPITCDVDTDEEFLTDVADNGEAILTQQLPAQLFLNFLMKVLEKIPLG